MRRLTWSLVLLLIAGASGAQTTGLQRLLDAEVARFPGRAGIWVKHLTTGDSAAVRADEAFNSASVIKLPVLALASRATTPRPTLRSAKSAESSQ